MKDEPITTSNGQPASSEVSTQAEPAATSTHHKLPITQSKLAKGETKTYNRRWMPLAIAVSVVISFTALYVSWLNLQSAKQYYAQGEVLMALQQKQSMQMQINAMAHEYGLAKSELLAQIARNSLGSQGNLLADIKTSLLVVERATDNLKASIIKLPNNPGLIKLLNETYRQEQAVLAQLVKLNEEF